MMQQQQRRLRDRIFRLGWWLDITYPLGLAVLMIYILTGVTYSDSKHRQIASYWEHKLLKISLKIAGPPPVPADSPVIAVNFSSEDIDEFGKTSVSGLMDGKIDTYAAVLRKLSVTNPKHLILSWTPGAHKPTDAAYAPLADAIKDLANTPLFVAYPQVTALGVPATFAASITPLSDLSCLEPVELICPYLPELSDWIVQRIFAVSAVNNENIKRTQTHGISSNLTISQPGYILHLAKRQQLPQFSFSQILHGDINASVLRDKIIFVGNNIVQNKNVDDQADLIRRVFTANDQTSDLRTDGTPLHLFWAALALQLIERGLIAVPTATSTTGMAALLCLTLWLSIALRGPILAITIYCALVLTMPAVNALGINRGWFFVPLFTIFYSGFIALLIASFVNLSLSTFSRWQSSAAGRLQSRTRALKENFVSMFSHNLNTPIAKFLGTLEIIKQQNSSDDTRRYVQRCLLTATQMQLLVRAALINAATRENSLSRDHLTLTSLHQDLSSTLPQAANRLGLRLQINKGPQNNQDEAPLSCDRRAIATMLLAILALNNQDSTNVDAELHIESPPSDAKDAHNLRLLLRGGAWPRLTYADLDAKNEAETAFDKLLRRVIVNVLRYYHAKIDCFDDFIAIEMTCRNTSSASPTFAATPPATMTVNQPH